jgi:cytochrome c-type biogenesis protein CcmH/NrfG
MDNELNQPGTAGTNWTPTATYVMGAICLLVGVLVGYVARGSAPTTNGHPVAASESAAPAATSAMPTAMSQGTAPHPPPTLDDMKRMADKKAEPLLAKLKTDPNNADTLNQLGILYRATHQFKEAEGYYEKALQVDPKNVNVRTDLASCLYYTGDVDGALAQLQKSLTYDPKHAGTLMNIGIIEWKGKNDANAAVAAWEKLLKLNPDFPQKEAVDHMIAEAKGQVNTAQSSNQENKN